MLSDASPIVLKCFCIVSNAVGHTILIRSAVGPCAACCLPLALNRLLPSDDHVGDDNQLLIGNGLVDKMDEYGYTGLTMQQDQKTSENYIW